MSLNPLILPSEMGLFYLLIYSQSFNCVATNGINGALELKYVITALKYGSIASLELE
jgi:hypothetical protein